MLKNEAFSSGYYNGFVKKSVTINASKKKIWKKISDVITLDWVQGLKKSICISEKKQGVGTVRKLIFQDGSIIKEHIVGWKNEQYFSYIAVSGLPLRGYHATISLVAYSEKSITVTWKSYFNSEEMTKKQFAEFCSFIELFYRNSLNALKTSLE
tara:strand:+ start:71 stop:532 length:462 start_codon:yes stop_codon:yes gene_type:complete